MKSGRLVSPALFFLRLFWLFKVFCVPIQIVRIFCSVKNVLGNLIGIALNLNITWLVEWFSQYWFFQSKIMLYLSICLYHLWFLASVSYSFLSTSLLPSLLLFSCSVMSDSLWPHGLQHKRLPWPSPSPRACSNSCPLNWGYYPIISSSVVLFSCLQSFPTLGAFLSQLFVSGGQSIGVSTSASDHPKNSQGWFPLGLTGWLSLQSKGSQESSPTPQFKSINSLVLSLLYAPTLTSIHDYWKNHSSD